jgi:hypothetical protein
MMTTDHLIDFLAGQLADTEAGWSFGTFGAIAEFTREAAEAASLDRTHEAVSVVTAKGGLRLTPCAGLRLIASESPTKESWGHRVALCLPSESCAMNRRSVLTEIGADKDALRIEDRAGVLFDLGLGTLQIDICIRSRDPELVTTLRGCTGTSVFAPGSGAMRTIMAANPHRVFISRAGRAEVFQPIPPPGGKSSDGPHTHVSPKLLAHGRTHAATEPLPEHWVPCAHLYPPHPLRDQLGRTRPFRRDHHDAFQLLLARHGDPERVALKRRVIESVLSGREPSAAALPDDRFARATVRVALRQLQASDQPSAALNAWLAAYDRLAPPDADDPMADDPMEGLH